MKKWEFEIQIGKEQVLDEIMSMIEHGLKPTVDNDELVSHASGTVTCNTDDGKIYFKLTDYSPKNL